MPRKPKRNYGKYYKYGRNTLDIASKALSTALMVKKLVNVEKKFINIPFTASASTTASVTHLTALAQGDTELTREGVSVKPQYLQLRIALTAHSSAGNSEYRLLVVRDKQQIADTTPGILDVLEVQTIESMRNHLTAERFNILWDYSWNTGNGGGDSIHKILKKNINLSGHLKYNGAASTDIQKGGIFLLYFSNQATNVVLVNGQSRIMFTDN